MKLTLRQFYAAQALASLTAAPDYSKGPCNTSIAERAFVIADCMIRAEAQTGTDQSMIRELTERCYLYECAIQDALSVLLMPPVRRVKDWEAAMYNGLSKVNSERFIRPLGESKATWGQS